MSTRSPCPASFSPAFPWLCSLRLFPVFIPAGMFTEIFFLFLSRPPPPHTGQGSSAISPAPWHFAHVFCVEMVPKKVFLECLSIPLPWHWPHSVFFVPGLAPLPLQLPHSSTLSISTCFFAPNTASSNERFILIAMSSPLRGPPREFCPNAWPKMSEKPEPKKELSKMSSKLKSLCLNPPVSNPENPENFSASEPNWS